MIYRGVRVVVIGGAQAIELPPFLAPDDRTARRVALDVARMQGYPAVRVLGQLAYKAKTYRITVDLSDIF